jgi:hypothetical protein
VTGSFASDRTWNELEGLPQPLRNAAHKAIFHLLEEPVPALEHLMPAPAHGYGGFIWTHPDGGLGSVSSLRRGEPQRTGLALPATARAPRPE